jgi:periplasmic protein TonB
MNASGRRLTPALIGSFVVHVLVAATLAFLVARASAPAARDAVAAAKPLPLVWLAERGLGGGGGGGGNRIKDPAPRASKPGPDAATIDSASRPPAPPAPSSSPAEVSPQRVVAPVVSIASGVDNLPGRIDAQPAPSTSSRGPGDGGGAGSGRGLGDGPGTGRGIGPGLEAGVGDGPYRPGGDVTMPIEIRKGAPQYTTEAMRARAQGAITVQCVVQTSGECTNIRVMHAFDPSFGLDQEAIKAAAQWRFRPGMRRGQPVPVLVTMEIAFALRGRAGRGAPSHFCRGVVRRPRGCRTAPQEAE